MTYEREKKRERKQRALLGSGPLLLVYVGENPSHVRETRFFENCTLYSVSIYLLLLNLTTIHYYTFLGNHTLFNFSWICSSFFLFIFFYNFNLQYN